MEIAIERIKKWTSGSLNLLNLGLTELPELPAGVTDLYCSYNCLTRLPETLPASLTCLVCSHNQLTTLPENLPVGLTTLWCHNNQLKTLPDTLPSGLTLLYCYYNQLIRLPETLPAGLTTLYCHSNNFPDKEYNESIPDYVARVKAITEAASKERIVQRCALYFEELAKKMWHPRRVERLMLAGVDMEDM